MTERPDGSLAPVTYLFGGSPEQETPGRSSRADASEERVPPTELAAAIEEIVARPRQEASTEPLSRTEKRARNVSIAALARRGVSVAEMRDLLERRELEPDTIEQEIDRLVSERLLDDELLAENVIRTSTERKGMGAAAIRAELKRRKIDPLVVETALGELDSDDEYERALEVATARARQLTSLDRETAERRLSGFLQRRGYGGSTLGRATRAALDATAVRRGPRFE